MDEPFDVNTEKRRVEEFWNKRRENAKYKPVEELKLQENSTSKSYCIQIQDLEKITYQIVQNQQQPVERLMLKLCIHLYYKKEKVVFGNTYQTVGLELIEVSQYTFKLTENNRPSIYFHSNLSPTDSIFAIFDFQIHEMGGKNIPINYKQIGIAELDLSKEGVNNLSVRKMPFTEYLNNPELGKAQDLGIKFTVQLNPSKEFEKAKHLVPMMFLVDNMQHDIEGLELDSETNKPRLSPYPLPMKLKQSYTIYLKQVEIHIPEAIETEILKNAQQNLMITNASGHHADAANSHKNIEKQGYKLSCCYHNNRYCVNSGGISNKLILKDSGRIDRQEEDDKKVTYRVLKYDGAMEISNVFASKSSMVVLQLEFKVILNTAQNRIDKDFIIGFLPIYISDKFGLADFKISEPLMSQGNKSIDLKGMMKFQVKYPIYLLSRFDLSSAFGGFSPRESMVSDKPSSRKMPKTQSQQSLQQGQQIQEVVSEPGVQDEKNNEILKRTTKLNEILRENQEKEKELEAYQNQLSKLKPQAGPTSGPIPPTHHRSESGGQVLPSSNTREFQEIVSQYESRVTELQKTIIQLRNENEQSKAEAQREFQEIKDLLGEIKRPRTSYNTFQDPFAAGRAQNEIVISNEDDKKRWEILETLTTVPKMKSNYKNQQAFALKPSSAAEELQNVDKVYLINKGVTGILDNNLQIGDDNFIDESDLINEYRDQYQASLFSIKIVGFKAQIANFEDHDNLKRDSIFSENYYVPEKMFFTFNFFEFDEACTESYSYQDAGQVTAMKKILTDNKPIVLETTSYLYNKIGPQQKSYNFNVDPSHFYPEVHRNFVDYLFRKSVHVDIWDADNLLLYGSAKVPLRSLLRRQKQSVEKQISVPIIDNDFSRERGRLIVFLTNKGFEPSVQEMNQTQQLNKTFQNSYGTGGFFKSQNNFNQTGMSNISNLNSTLGHKKKIKSYEPLNYEQAASVSQMQSTMKNNYEFSNDPDARQRERIRRFKIKNLQKEKGEDADVARYISKQEESLKKIQEIQILKDANKGNYIKNVLSQLLTQEYIIDAQFGTTKYIKQTVTNTGFNNTTFSIRVDDPDFAFLGFNELNPVTSPEEWKLLMETEDIKGPKDTNMIERERMQFMLEKGQSITLIFKFLSYREIDPQADQSVNLEEHLRSQPMEFRQKFVYQRVIDVSITSADSPNENQGFKLRVRPHRQVVDHVFRYYERGNKQVQLILPALYSFGNPPSVRPTMFCTNQNVQFEWMGDNEISLQLRVPSVLKITRFNLLAYADTFFRELLANWEIEIHSLEGVDIKIDMGQSKKTNLTLDSDGTRLVRFYSSHPLCAWFEKPFDQPYTVSKGKVNLVGLTMRSFSMMRQKVQINCVDQSTKELLYSWMVRIETEKPVVSKMYDLKIPVNKESHIQKFSYQNRTGTESTFFIESSQIDILQIVEPKVFLGIGEKSQIKIRISRQEQPGIAEVFVFITNTDEKMECILFKLYFTVNK